MMSQPLWVRRDPINLNYMVRLTRYNSNGRQKRGCEQSPPTSSFGRRQPVIWACDGLYNYRIARNIVCVLYVINSSCEDNDMTTEWPPLPPIRTGIKGLCPRCGQGHLFDGFLSLKPRCESRGLDYSFADPADGPAFFVICFNSASRSSPSRSTSKLSIRPRGGSTF